MKTRIIITLLLFTLLLVCSCGNTTDDNTEVDYKVTVLDGGAPLADVVVQFGTEMSFTNQDGVATMKLKKGDYVIKVTDMAKNEYFLGGEVKLTKDKTDVTVNVCKRASSLPFEAVHDNGTPLNKNDDRKAYLVNSAGSYYLSGLSSEELTFFLFTPIQDGIYQFSINVEGEVGYYGAPINALDTPIEPLANEDGIVELEIKKKNLASADTIATPYLIGFKTEASECIFSLNRVSDPEYTKEDDPYTYITNPQKLESLFLSYKNWNVKTTNIDVFSADTKVVYNESDKCYHLGAENGPVIYVRIGSDSEYLPGLYTVCETSLMSSYIYDEEGNYIGKEAYNALINQYHELCDEKTGLYPLDKYIERAIKNHGSSAGWWNSKSPMYLFGEKEVNENNAWLFACCTIEIDKTSYGTSETPIDVQKSVESKIVTEKAIIAKNDTMYFNYKTPTEAKLELADKDGQYKVIYNGQEYVAKNGKITVNLDGTVKAFQIVNLADEEKVIEFTIS